MNAMQFPGLVFFVSTVVFWQGCLFSGPEDSTQPPGAGNGFSEVHLQLSPAALVRGEKASIALVDSVHIRITGADMAPFELGYKGDSLVFNLRDLPAGVNRVINADLYKGGRQLYSGRGTFTLRREVRLEAALICNPQFSRVVSRFHLPLGLPMPVVAGSLKLLGERGEFKAVLKKQGEYGSFTVEELPGDSRYDVSLALSDSAGKVRYEASRKAVFLPLGEEAKWDLSLLPTEAQAGVALTLATPKVAQLQFGFPSLLRSPKMRGEIVISEFLAAPAERDSSTSGEWFELFNRSADTLNLTGCRLSRDGGEGVTRSLAFDSAQILLPGQATVFGRSAAKAQVHYQDFTLVNTAASLLLLCKEDALVVDSLRYSAANSDSLPLQLRPLPMKEGWVTSLNADSLGSGFSSASWCLTQVNPSSDWEPMDSELELGSVYATPGRVARCRE